MLVTEKREMCRNMTENKVSLDFDRWSEVLLFLTKSVSAVDRKREEDIESLRGVSELIKPSSRAYNDAEGPKATFSPRVLLR